MDSLLEKYADEFDQKKELCRSIAAAAESQGRDLTEQDMSVLGRTEGPHVRTRSVHGSARR